MTFSTWLGVIFLVLASPLYMVADGVVTNNTCTLTDLPRSGPPAVISQTGIDNCLIIPNGQHGRASASTSVTLHLPVSGQAATPIGASVLLGASANPIQFGPVQEYGDAVASVTIDYLFTTAGPVRAGFIQLNQPSESSVSFVPGPDRPILQRANIAVGPLSQTCPGSYPYATCSGSLTDPMTRFLPTTTLPFTLGQNFPFHEDVTLGVDSFQDIIENGSTLTNFTFTLFEADGVTPVEIALATPEPGSQMLSACGLLALVTLTPLLTLARVRGRTGHKMEP
jgi:hypothetical protein